MAASELQGVEEELNSVVREYLVQCSYNASLEMFDAECAKKGHPNDTAQKVSLREKLKVAHIQNETISALENGDYTEFFTLWERGLSPVVLQNDPTCHRLEFYVNVAFAIQPLHPSSPPAIQSLSAEATMGRFRQFLETRGAAMNKTTEFLSFFALPFVPDPQHNPSFAELFQPDWFPSLKARLQSFLSSTLATQSKPRLYYFYVRNKAGRKLGVTEDYVEAVQKQIAECEEREMQYIDRHNRLQKEYHNIVGIAAELVEALASCVSGKMVSSDYLANVCSRLNLFSSQPTATVSLRGTNATLDSAIGKDTELAAAAPPLGFDAIKRDLSSKPERDVVLLLQALRWRLTRAKSRPQRLAVLDDFVASDLLCIVNTDTDQPVYRLLEAESSLVQQYLSRFLNCIASVPHGRTYMGMSSTLIPYLHARLLEEKEDSLCRQNVLGTLQKLSLRRPAQSAMIRLGMIEWLTEELRHVDDLSEYTVEYAGALLMNLTLRTEGKRRARANATLVLETLSNLLEMESVQFRTYVHGSLYSLLTVPDVQAAAQAMGLEAVLKAQIKISDDTMRSQLQYILQQLGNDVEPLDDDYTSDDEGDDDQDPDSDEDLLEADLGDGEAISAPAAQSGEQLLCSLYPVGGVLPTPAAALGAGPQDPPLLSRPVTPDVRKLTGSAHDLTQQRDGSEGQPEAASQAEHAVGAGHDAGTALGSRPATAAGSRPETGHGSRPVTGAGPRISRSRPDTARSRPTSSTRRPVSRPLPKAEGDAGAVAGEGEANEDGAADDSLVPQAVPVDESAANLLVNAIGEKKDIAQASSKPAPPSDKALQALGDGEVQLDEYYAAFSTRVKVPRTP